MFIQLNLESPYQVHKRHSSLIDQREYEDDNKPLSLNNSLDNNMYATLRSAETFSQEPSNQTRCSLYIKPIQKSLNTYLTTNEYITNILHD